MGLLDKISGAFRGEAAQQPQQANQPKSSEKKSVFAGAKLAKPATSKRNGPNPIVYDGERNYGNWKDAYFNKSKDERQMVCHDSSGKTQDISGEFRVGKNGLNDMKLNVCPRNFHIIDSSSGQRNDYLFEKVGADKQGNPIYKCISKNKEKLEDNRYTLEWKDNATPTLIQHKNQKNYGTGLKVVS